jgi:hypothetical protein
MVDAAFLARARRFSEDQMPDTCRITKPGGGRGQLNPATGKYDTAPEPVTVYEGACKIPRRDNTGSTSQATAGDETWDVGEYPLALPLEATGSADVEPGMTVTYLTAAHDAALVGRVFGITAPGRQSTATARRFRMKEVTGGG